jgi:cytochrome c-type biogenesis protein CcmH/NrfF
VAEYGEKILSSPTTEGFNLLAWYGPYVAIVGSALMILVVIRRWRGPAAVAGTPAAAKPPISDDARRRLDDELDDVRP